MSAVYQAEKIRVREGPISVTIGASKCLLQHPEPRKPDGQLSDEAKALLVEEVLAAVRRTGFRMCLVWGPSWCSFVEPNGSIKNSFDPPTGGISMTASFDFGVTPSD